MPTKRPRRARAIAGASLIAAVALFTGLATWAQGVPAGPVSQLMPDRSEARDLEQASFKRMIAQATPNPNAKPEDRMMMEALLKSPPPSPQIRRRNLLRETVVMMEEDYPAPRTIPEGKIVEASVSVRLPDGKVLGPYRMYSSMAPGFEEMEFASGENFAIPEKPLSFAKGGVPDVKDFVTSNMMFFDADGDERFIGAVLASVESDGRIRVNLATVIDGQALRVIGVAAKPGEAIELEAVGRYRLTVKSVLRDMKEVEQRWHRQAVQNQAELAANSHTPSSVRRFNPEWPGPALVRSGALYMPSLANARFVCADWKTKFSNDPKVDIGRIGPSPVTLAFDANGQPQIVPPPSGGAFPPNVFPTGLATEQSATVLRGPGNFNHLARSPTLADIMDFMDLDQPSPGLVWQRIRRENGIVYRTHLFVRCRKAA